MGDDAELWIESGGDPTTLIMDEYLWEDDEYDDQNFHKKRNTMVFIDGESVSADHCASIIGQCKKVGELFEARYYAMQKDKSTANWKDVADQYGIKPVLISGQPSKNRIDYKIIKDIKYILEKNRSIDVFCLATRDGDYSEVVEYIRSRGKRPVVLATKNTSQRLKKMASEVRGI